MKSTWAFLFLIILTLISCNNDEDPKALGNFTVTIENIFEAKDYFQSGTTDVVLPGSSISFIFNAGKGHYLNLSTMFVQSNDLFYAFSEEGIALYEADGTALTGNVTALIALWDAGTEVNQEPGTGSDQAPRQSEPNTGTAENGTIKLIENVNDGFTYPSKETIIKVMLAHDGSTQFTVTIENVSNTGTFETPLAPGVWAVHNDQGALFSSGETASGNLEALAEDGMNASWAQSLDLNTGLVSPFAPGVWAVSTSGSTLFTENQVASDGLEALAEDGDPTLLNTEIDSKDQVNLHGVFSAPVGQSGPAPLFPSQSYTFSFQAEEGDRLTLATMLVQTNDLFIALPSSGVELFNNGVPISTDLTSGAALWDAGTETNEFPGAGNNQAPRQSGPDSGPDESGMVVPVSDAYTYPTIGNMIRIHITSNGS